MYRQISVWSVFVQNRATETAINTMIDVQSYTKLSFDLTQLGAESAEKLNFQE